ncbi:MAG: bis-aminopropyl spermidine synthase family protein [Caldiserica bacterium]|nr:bis-aminopropyl spermidine synthase family protein [Caldisericota bacterium]
MNRVREDIIRVLSGRKLSFWEFLSAQGYSLKEVVQELKKLLAEEVIIWDEQEKKLYLQKAYPPFPDYTCSACKGKGKIIREKFQEALNKFKAITINRPIPIPEFDQGYILPQDLAQKAILMSERGDLDHKDILILGDDDLFSLYLSLLGTASRIVVLEIDKRLLQFLTDWKEKENLNLEFRVCDLSNPLPPELLSSFDVFVSEPPESLEGLKIFFSRGREGLRENGAGYVGLTRLESSTRKWREIELWLLNNNFVITDILKDFSRYAETKTDIEKFYPHFRLLQELPFSPGPVDFDWYTSYLLRIVKLKEEQGKFSSDLYMDEETWTTPAKFRHES